MRRGRIKVKIYGIQKKLWLYMIALILPALILVTLGVSIIAGKTVRKNLEEQYSYVNDKFYRAFQGLYDSLDAVTENCITNTNVQNSLKNKELSLYDKEVISRTLQFVGGELVDAYVYMDNKGNYYSRSSIAATMDVWKESDLYLGLQTSYSKVKLFWHPDIFWGQEKMVLYAGRNVRQFERDYAPGALYMKLHDAVLDKLLEETGNDNPVYFLVDDKGTVCYRRYPENFGEQNESWKSLESDVSAACMGARETLGYNLESSMIAGKKGLLFVRKHEPTGFSTVTFVPDQIVHEVTRDMIRVIIFLFLLVLGIAFWMSHYVAKQFTKPIRYISGFMENIDDTRLDCPILLHTNTELDEIGKSYNNMLARITSLIGQVTYKERELRKAEMDTLLYQIHPHFLYNTLDTVYMLARISKEETIMKMVQALSKYLRIILSNGAEEIRIEDEIQQVKAYLDIQNIRNNDRFTYEFHVDESIRKLPVIKMILQPLAENCIKHAFTEDEEAAGIWISARQIEDEIVFMVENNGTLMAEKERIRMNRLETADMDAADAAVSKEQGGYGIWNVVKRLRLRYQEHIRFYYIVSAQRTTCVIKIKKEWMENHEEQKNQEDSSGSSGHHGDSGRL